MKKFAIVIVSLGALAALTGCATPGPNYVNTTYAQPGDPSQWRVVSVTPVPVGTGAQHAAAGQASASSPAMSPNVTYSTPITSQPVVVQQTPVYVQQPVYVPQPVYVQEPNYWYPPISIGLGFDFGRGWGGHRHRGWGGSIGTRFPYRR
jgi:hypothetical protein